MLLAASLTTAILSPRGAYAYTFVVPDDYPSVNQALDDVAAHRVVKALIVPGGDSAA